MKDSKYLKEDGGDDAKDDAEADEDGMNLFKKKSYKSSKQFSHSKGFSGNSNKSFARKRKRVK